MVDGHEEKEPEKIITSIYISKETMEWLEQVKKRTGRNSISNVVEYICTSLSSVETNQRRPMEWLK